VVSYLALEDKPHFIARAGVGPNAGHTVEHKGKKYGLRLTPSGFLYEKARLLVGAGVLVNPEVMLKEIEDLGIEKRIGIDKRCGIIGPEHIESDKSTKHLSEFIGSTGSGCGPANKDRVDRRLKLAGDVAEFEPYLTDVALELNEGLDAGKRVIIEGSQALGLSLFYGTYPFVTSKDTSAGMAAVDVGVGPTRVKEVVAVFKAFPTRVGQGPFPTEMSMEESEKMGIVEYGTVTRRRRRIGRFDFEAARYSAMINSATQIAITMLDKLDKGCEGARSHDELSKEARDFVGEAERRIGVPVTIISTGPDLKDTIDLREEKRHG